MMNIADHLNKWNNITLEGFFVKIRFRVVIIVMLDMMNIIEATMNSWRGKNIPFFLHLKGKKSNTKKNMVIIVKPTENSTEFVTSTD